VWRSLSVCFLALEILNDSGRDVGRGECRQMFAGEKIGGSPLFFSTHKIMNHTQKRFFLMASSRVRVVKNAKKKFSLYFQLKRILFVGGVMIIEKMKKKSD
jgi:hypothetical protein